METDNEKTRHDDGIVAILHVKAQFSRYSTPPTDTDWKLLDLLARERFPHLTATLQKCETLSLQEWRTCILVRLGFKNGEIALLLRPSVQRVHQHQGECEPETVRCKERDATREEPEQAR